MACGNGDDLRSLVLLRSFSSDFSDSGLRQSAAYNPLNMVTDGQSQQHIAANERSPAQPRLATAPGRGYGKGAGRGLAAAITASSSMRA